MKNKKIIILLTFVATLMILCSYNIVNATKNNVNGFITLDQPPGLLLKANEEKFDNVQVTLKDDDGIKTNTIKIYALDNAGKVIKNATFLVGNPTISKDQKNVTYTVSNKYLNKQTKKFRIIAEDKNGKTLDSSFRIMGKATHYTRDFPPRLKELNFN